MKKNFTLLKLKFLTLSLLIFFSIKGFSQPDYIFQNSSLVSGTDNEVGAVYRFPSVKPGIDAMVSIDFISLGIKIADFDDTKNGGFDEAFQPRITAKGNTKGHVEFTIVFVKEGTEDAVQMTEVPATSIDVDGNTSTKDSMLEYDEYFTPGAYFLDYDLVSTDLSFTYNTGSVMGKNNRGMEKTQIDTLAMEAMFSVIYPNTSAITVRIGLDNRLPGTTTRQRSVYFKRFFFPNSFLPMSNLVSFSGNKNEKQEVVLNGKFRDEHDYINASIEKSNNGSSFSSIGVVNVTGNPSMQFIDNAKNTSSAYYRLKLIDKNGKIGYSAILFMKAVDLTNKVSVFPSMVNDNTNISFASTKANTAKISLYDQSGRLLLKKEITAQAGTTTVSLTGLSQFSTGQYFVVVSSEGRNYTQKIQRNN